MASPTSADSAPNARHHDGALNPEATEEIAAIATKTIPPMTRTHVTKPVFMARVYPLAVCICAGGGNPGGRLEVRRGFVPPAIKPNQQTEHPTPPPPGPATIPESFVTRTPLAATGAVLVSVRTPGPYDGQLSHVPRTAVRHRRHYRFCVTRPSLRCRRRYERGAIPTREVSTGTT